MAMILSWMHTADGLPRQSFRIQILKLLFFIEFQDLNPKTI